MKIITVTIALAYPDKPEYEPDEIMDRMTTYAVDRLDACGVSAIATTRKVDVPDPSDEGNGDDEWYERAQQETEGK